jgi:CrcB protein
MGSILYIALGGAAGAFLRYWSGIAASFLFGKRFPMGTLFVNVAGSFIIGLAASAIASGRLDAHPLNDVLMLGFCGAFTTFSTFSLDTFRLCRRGRMAAAWGNLILSMVLCLSAAALGLATFPAEQGAPAVHSAPLEHPAQPENVHPVQPARPAQF